MTERQKSLKYEIIQISNDLQLGIDENEQDWFFQFIQKMDYGIYVDSYRTNYNGWCKIDDFNLSIGFVREFINKFNWRINWLQNVNKLPVIEVLEKINSDYIMTWDWYLLNAIGESKELNNTMVFKYEKLFDQTCESRERNGAPGGNNYTAWHFISNNPKISGQAKSLAKSKMQYNDSNSSKKKSLLERIFA